LILKEQLLEEKERKKTEGKKELMKQTKIKK
jgi:hypothetical protein